MARAFGLNGTRIDVGDIEAVRTYHKTMCFVSGCDFATCSFALTAMQIDATKIFSDFPPGEDLSSLFSVLRRGICDSIYTAFRFDFENRSTSLMTKKKVEVHEEEDIVAYYLSDVASKTTTTTGRGADDAYAWMTHAADVSWSKKSLHGIDHTAGWFGPPAALNIVDDIGRRRLSTLSLRSPPSLSLSSSSSSASSSGSLESSLESVVLDSKTLSGSFIAPQIGERSRLNDGRRYHGISADGTDENLRRFNLVESLWGPVCTFVRVLDLTTPLKRWIEYTETLADGDAKKADEILKVYVSDLHLEKIRFYNDFSLECNRGAPLLFFLSCDRSIASSTPGGSRDSHSLVCLVKTIYHLFFVLGITDKNFPRIAKCHGRMIHLCLCDVGRRDFFNLAGNDEYYADRDEENAAFTVFDKEKDDLFFYALKKEFKARLGLCVVSDAFLRDVSTARDYLKERRKKRPDRAFVNFIPFRDFRKKTTNLCLSYYLGPHCKKTYSKRRVFESVPFLSAYNVAYGVTNTVTPGNVKL